MAGGSFVLDDILQHLNLHQYKKLAELWIRLEILTDGTIPSFSQEHLNAAGVVTLKTQSGNDLKIDMSFLHRKPLQKALLELSQAQLSEALRRNVKHEDPDTLLVRFLRAHNWKLDDAMVMLLKNIAWRIEKRIEEDLIPGGDLQFAKLAKDGSSEKQKVGKEVIDFRSSGEHFVHGQDKEGRLLEFIRVKLHNPKAQGPEAFEKGTILDAENTRMLLRPPVTTASAVFDLTGFGMSNMDMTALKVMSSGLQDNYPESLGNLYVFNAPWIVNGIWSMIKSWLNPIVASKVHFVSSVKALEEFISIDNIPKYMGGSSEYEFQWTEPEPRMVLDSEKEAERDALWEARGKLLDEYNALTRSWAETVLESGRLDEEKMAKRHEVVLKLRHDYWKLDPYIRGSTMLDRDGSIEARRQ